MTFIDWLDKRNENYWHTMPKDYPNSFIIAGHKMLQYALEPLGEDIEQ